MSSDDEDDDNDQYLSDVDLKIKDYVKEISDFLSSLKSERENSGWNREKEEHALELQDFLKETLFLLPSAKGLEEFFIQHIGEFREQNGIRLLQTSCEECMCDNTLRFQEFPCDNTDPSELWQYFIHYLQQYSLQRLKSHSLLLTDKISMNVLSIKCYTELLKSVYEPECAWNIYQRQKTELLHKFESNCNSDCFGCFLEHCLNSICTDQLFVFTDDFRPAQCSWTTILSPYFQLILDKLSIILTRLEDWSRMKSTIPTEISDILKCRKKFRYSEQKQMCITCLLIDKVTSKACEMLEDFTNTHQDQTCAVSSSSSFDCLYSQIILDTVKSLFVFEYQVNALGNAELNIPEYLHEHDFSLKLISEDISECSSSKTAKVLHYLQNSVLLAAFSHLEIEKNHKDPGLHYALPCDSPVTSPLHAHQENPTAIDLETFSKQWRLLVVKYELLTRMQKMLQEHVQNTVQSCIKQEQTILSSGRLLSVLSGSNQLQCYSSSFQLNSVLPSAVEVVTELEKFFPLLYSSSGPLISFVSSFCHAVSTFISEVLRHIESIASDPSNKLPGHHIYIALSSILFIRDHLVKYQKCMVERSFAQSESHLKYICDAADELVNCLTEELYTQHVKHLECGVLLDAESYDFSDTKSFCDGERVSFGIQMWNMHMKAILTDIQYYLPKCVAQELYARILCESLLRFAVRYGQSQPTEARTPQLRADVLTILLCTSDLITPACEVPSQLVGRDFSENVNNSSNSGKFVAKIHSLCCTLLSILAVLTAPVSEIYKTFSKGFPIPSLAVLTKYNSITPWLPWIRTNLFPEPGNNLLMSTVSVWLSVSMCTSWLVSWPTAVIKAFATHHCTLSILMMSQASYVSEDESSTSTGISELKTQLASSIFRLFSQHESGTDISNILLPVIERTNGWIEFDKSRLMVSASERPWWYQGFVKTLDTYYESVLQNFVPVLLQWRKLFFDDHVLEAWTKIRRRFSDFVTCTCGDENDDALSLCFEAEKMGSNSVQLPFSSISKLLDSLVTYLFVIPSPIKWCLSTLDEYFENYVSDAEPIHNSVSLQVLGSHLISCLHQPGQFHTITGYSMCSEEVKFCTKTAEVLKEVLLDSGESLNISESQNISARKQLSQVAKHLRKFRKSCKQCKSEKTGNDCMEDEIIKITAERLLSQHDGMKMIAYLQKLLCLNESWIKSSLGIPEMLSDSVFSTISPEPLSALSNRQVHSVPDVIAKDVSFTEENSGGRNLQQDVSGTSERTTDAFALCGGNDGEMIFSNTFTKESLSDATDEKPTSRTALNLNVEKAVLQYTPHFNPFEHFDHLKEHRFNDAVKSMPEFSWEALLSHLPILGLTEAGFASLLSRRWDVRGEGPVSNEERLLIQELRLKYTIS